MTMWRYPSERLHDPGSDRVLLKKSSIDGNKYTKDYESNDAALGYF